MEYNSASKTGFEVNYPTHFVGKICSTIVPFALFVISILL